MTRHESIWDTLDPDTAEGLIHITKALSMHGGGHAVLVTEVIKMLVSYWLEGPPLRGDGIYVERGNHRQREVDSKARSLRRELEDLREKYQKSQRQPVASTTDAPGWQIPLGRWDMLDPDTRAALQVVMDAVSAYVGGHVVLVTEVIRVLASYWLEAQPSREDGIYLERGNHRQREADREVRSLRRELEELQEKYQQQPQAELTLEPAWSVQLDRSPVLQLEADRELEADS